MKVYTLYFGTFGYGMFGSGNTRIETVATYASEGRVKQEIATRKEKWATNNPEATIQDREDGRGFSVSPMHCSPGWWYYEEQEVIE